MHAARVLQVHSDLVGGGIEKQIVTLATHLDVGHVGICYCPTNHPPPPREAVADIEAKGVELLPVRPPLLSPAYLPRLVQIIRAFRPTVLHLHAATIGVIGGLAGRTTRCPAIVYTEHCEHTGYPAWLRRLREWAGRIPDRTVCVSRRVRQSLMAQPTFARAAERLLVIPNAIDLTAYRSSDDTGAVAATRAETGVGGDECLIGSVGLLLPAKGYEYLLRAMPGILARHPRAVAAIVGGGDLEPELRSLADSLGIAGRVRFLGWRDDIPRLLASFDLYVQPSVTEGLPLAPIEASAAGLPIVAADAGGMTEVVEDGRTGLIVPVGDVAALERSICSLLADRARAGELSAAARERAFREFSADSMSARYAELYRSL